LGCPELAAERFCGVVLGLPTTTEYWTSLPASYNMSIENVNGTFFRFTGKANWRVLYKRFFRGERSKCLLHGDEFDAAVIPWGQTCDLDNDGLPSTFYLGTGYPAIRNH